MTDHMAQSLGSTVREIEEYIVRDSQWPDPNAGFLDYIRAGSSNLSSIRSTADEWPPEDRLRHAPSLACFGFVKSCAADFGSELTAQWKSRLQALLGRDPFPLDRQSFAFRPVELLGIAVGVSAVTWDQNDILNSVRTVVADCYTKGNSDAYSRLLYSLAATELRIDGLSICHSPDSVSDLDYAALFLWAISRFSDGFPDDVGDCVADAEELVIRSSLQGRYDTQDVGRAGLLSFALTEAIERRISSRLSETRLTPAVTDDAVSLVCHLCRSFPLFAKQLLVRRRDVKVDNSKKRLCRSTVEMTDEYDVQDTFHALLKLFFDNVKAEEWTPSYAGNQNRVDFVLPDQRIVIEAKYFGKKLKNRDIAQQLIIDERYYRQHSDCDALIAIIYDPELRCENPRAFERDITDGSDFRVIPIVCPQGL